MAKMACTTRSGSMATLAIRDTASSPDIVRVFELKRALGRRVL